ELRVDASAAAGASGRRRLYALAPAAAAVVLIVLIGVVWRPRPSAAVVENADGALHRVVGGTVEKLQAGERIAVGDVVRSNGGGGCTLVLADGSRVEMRSQSELSLERAGDGERIHLRTGGVIINAAKQGSGHLYVQTKDITVSVVGTVFLVNAEE